MPGMPGVSVGPTPIIRIYGVTMEGHSVMAHVHGFHPYFFVPAVPGFKEEDCNKFKVLSKCHSIFIQYRPDLIPYSERYFLI